MKPFHFGHRINILGRLFVKRLNEKIANTGVTVSQWSVIARLLYHEKLTQTEICEQLSIEAPAISKTLWNMETAGLVIRDIAAHDKREKEVTLTDKAKENLPVWLESINDLEIEAMSGIASEDIEAFNRVLNQMFENLRKDR